MPAARLSSVPPALSLLPTARGCELPLLCLTRLSPAWALSYFPGVCDRTSVFWELAPGGGTLARQLLTTGGTQEQRAGPGPASRVSLPCRRGNGCPAHPRPGPFPASTTLGGQDARPCPQPTCSAEDQPPRPQAWENTGGHSSQLSPSRCRQRPGPLAEGTLPAGHRSHRACLSGPRRGSCAGTPSPRTICLLEEGSVFQECLWSSGTDRELRWGPVAPTSHPTEMGLHLQWPEASCWHKGGTEGHGGWVEG